MSNSSDKKGERAIHVTISCLVGALGFFGLFIIPYNTSAWISLGITQIAILGSAATVPLVCVWLSEVIPSNKPKLLAVATATMVTFGQTSGIIAPSLYAYLGGLSASVSEDGKSVPSYKFAHLAVNISLLIAALLTLTLRALLKTDRWLFINDFERLLTRADV